MTKIRLNKYLSSQGVCSRRKADEHISNGNITVNGQRVEKGTQIEPGSDIVMLYGRDIAVSADSDLRYFAFYKPKGIITTLDDELHRKSLAEYLKKEKGLKPVGRLDKDSEGLLILTDDGDAIYELTHPKFEHDKEYYVEAHMSDHFQLKDLGRLISGINVDKIKMRAVSVSHVMVEKRKNLIKFNLVLRTGYNRQIRRTCDKIGLSVEQIIRVRFGKLTLDSVSLKPGQLRQISLNQIK